MTAEAHEDEHKRNSQRTKSALGRGLAKAGAHIASMDGSAIVNSAKDVASVARASRDVFDWNGGREGVGQVNVVVVLGDEICRPIDRAKEITIESDAPTRQQT